MKNTQKRLIRRTISAIGAFLLVFSGVIFAGVEFPFFNLSNPAYNPYYFVIASIILFIGRTYIKEKRMIWNSLGFFERSGLTTMYDVPAENVGMTHITFTDKAGERRKVKHHHPFAIPSEEGYDNVYLTPKAGFESLDPEELIQKYGPKLTLEQITFLKNLKMPEIEALNPDALSVDMVERDDPDALNQEMATIVADIRKGFLGNLKGLKESWFYILAGVMIGGLAFTLIFMGLGVNFGAILAR